MGGGTAYLRFGDSVQGKQPSPDFQLMTSYRIVNQAMEVPGLDWVEPTRFREWNRIEGNWQQVKS